MSVFSLLSGPKPARRPLLAALLTAAAPVFSACDQAIDVPEPEHTPRVALALTLDNLAPADTARRNGLLGRWPFVSVSQRLYDLRPLQGRTDATLEVRDAGGTVVEQYRSVMRAPSPYGGYYNQGQYRPMRGFRFSPGQSYAVRAVVPGFEATTGTLTMPTAVPVQVSAQRLGTNNSGQDRARVTVSFDDPADPNDYYVATVRLLDQNGQQVGYVYLDEDNSGVNVALPYQLSNLYDQVPFSDDNANGQRISFSNNVVYYANTSVTGPVYIEVTLSHITPDMFRFLKSYGQYQDNDGNPFAEPTPLYANVSSGFGIFGGAADTWQQAPL